MLVLVDAGAGPGAGAGAYLRAGAGVGLRAGAGAGLGAGAGTGLGELAVVEMLCYTTFLDPHRVPWHNAGLGAHASQQCTLHHCKALAYQQALVKHPKLKFAPLKSCQSIFLGHLLVQM